MSSSKRTEFVKSIYFVDKQGQEFNAKFVWSEYEGYWYHNIVSGSGITSIHDNTLKCICKEVIELAEKDKNYRIHVIDSGIKHQTIIVNKQSKLVYHKLVRHSK